MIYTAVEWLALIIAVLSLVKIGFVLIKPKVWMNLATKFWKNPKTVGIFSLILSAVVLYFLLQEITIVQIFATLLFFILLMAMGFAPYIKGIISTSRKNIKKIIREQRVYLLVWLVLIIWVLWEIFKY